MSNINPNTKEEIQQRRVRSILIAQLKPSLNEQKELDSLILFKNGIA